MTPEGSGLASGPAIAPTVPAGLMATGAELVAVSERFYRWVFVGGLGFIAVSTLTALAFLPLRASARSGRPPASAVGAAVLVLVFSGLAIWRADRVYLELRRRPSLELLPVLVAAVLLSVVSPLRNELWWSACAILMVLGALVPVRRALLYCLVALLANLAAHVVSGDLAATPAVGIVGLWINLPCLIAMAAVIPDHLAAHILRLNVVGGREPPLRVRASTAADRGSVRREEIATGGVRPAEVAAVPESPPPAAGGGSTSRLTARQLQVVALLADGQRYADIAACLSISAGQVHRHVAHAIERLGVRGVNELVAVAVADGMLPGEGGRPAADAAR